MLSITRSRAGGFTLIEVVLVLVILAILVGLSLPAMNSYIRRTQVASVAGELAGDFNNARALAVRSGRATEVVLASTSYTVRRTDPQGDVKRVNLARDFPGMVLLSGDGNSLTLRFNSRGMLEGGTTATPIIVVRGAMRDSLFVMPTGRVHRDY